jgi:hypothetical protein
MRVHFVHHPDDRAFAAEVERLMAAHRIERWPTAEGSDVALVLASRAALRDGLGDAPQTALRAAIPILTVLLHDDAVPLRFPAARKHLPQVSDPAGALRLLEDHRRNAAAKIADGKRELFGLGVLAALLARA